MTILKTFLNYFDIKTCISKRNSTLKLMVIAQIEAILIWTWIDMFKAILNMIVANRQQNVVHKVNNSTLVLRTKELSNHNWRKTKQNPKQEFEKTFTLIVSFP